MIQLSIIVPVYNVERYLEKCLDSLVHQTLEDFEILVVNDGSQDDSQTIIDRYAQHHPNLVIGLKKPNGGLSDARNYGLLQARGEFIAFVDSDDYVDTDLFEKLLKKAKDHQAEIAVCDLLYEYEDSTVKLSSGGDFEILHPKTDSSVLLVNNSACNKIFKRELLNKHPFIKGIWYEDLATIPLVMMEAKTIVKIEGSHYHYLQRESSIVHSKNPKVFDIYIALENLLDGIRMQKNVKNFMKPFHQLCVVQGVHLTNLRIKEYQADRIDFWRQNHSKIEALYPQWYFNRKVWSMGIKHWIVFTIFKLKRFDWMNRVYG